jgi:hypothetical protein
MFGLSTTLITVIAVVVLLILLGLLVLLSARQKRAKNSAMRGLSAPDKAAGRPAAVRSPARMPETPLATGGIPVETVVSSPPEEATLPAVTPAEAAGAVVADALGAKPAESLLKWDTESAEEPSVPEAPEVAPIRETVAPAEPPAAPPAPSLADPVSYLVGSLLEGQGDLSEPELRRLELYRPAKVIAVAELLKEQLAGKGRETKLARLARIQQYAETLRVRGEQKTAAQPVAASPAQPEAPLSLATELTNLDFDKELSVLPPKDAASQPESAEAPTPEPVAPLAPALTLVPPAPDEPVPAPSVPSFAAVEGPMVGGLVWDAPAAAGATQVEPETESTPVEPTPSEEPQPAVAPVAPFTLASEEWSQVEEAAVAVEEVVVEEPAVETEMPAEAVEMAPEAPPVETLESVTGTPTHVAEGIASEAAAPTLAAQTQDVDQPADAAPAVGTAEHVLSLPAAEQADALATLTAAEIARVLSHSTDRDLKLAALSVLERQGTPDALFAINESMDDSDQDVQLHALEAAERLLAKQ